MLLPLHVFANGDPAVTELFFQQELSVAKILITLSMLALLGYASIVGALYLAQERIIFPGTKLPPDHKFSFDQPYREVQVEVPGASLNALHITQPAPRGLLFFIHGNGGDLSTWTTGVDFYRKVNYDLFIFDYRGYGKSTGKIESEAQLHADVRAAWDTIAPQYRARKIPIVIYGRSLGTGLAAQLARDVDPALVIMVSSYTSLLAASKRTYTIAPDWILKYPLRTDAIIGDVKSPIMMIHGKQDELIPHTDSEQLRKHVRAPSSLLIIDGAGHNDIHQFPVYLEALEADSNHCNLLI